MRVFVPQPKSCLLTPANKYSYQNILLLKNKKITCKILKLIMRVDMSDEHKYGSGKSDRHPRYLFKHKVAVFSVYLIIFLSILAWLDYYVYEIYSPLPFSSCFC